MATNSSTEWTVQCSACGHVDDIENFDVMGADEGHLFCNECGAHMQPVDPEQCDTEGWLRPKDPKGGDPAEWPEELRVREFPEVAL